MKQRLIDRYNITITGNQDGQVILFAHGFGCDQGMWRYVVPAFETDYKVVLFDYIGHGRANLDAYNRERYASLHGYAQDVLDICHALDLQHVILVGHSVSSMIGTLACIREPDRFYRLIMVGPSPRYINDGDYYGGFEQEDIDGLLAMMDGNFFGWATSLAPAIMGNEDRPQLGLELGESFCRTDLDVALQFAQVTFYSDNRADLPKLQTPSLVIQSLDDIIAPVEVGEYITQKAPNSRLRIISATGHCPHLSAPAERPKSYASIWHPSINPLHRTMQEITPLIPCGVLVLNAESCIVSINPFACTLLGYEASELVGKRIDTLLTIPSRIYFQTHIYPLIALRKVASELYLNVQTRQRAQIPVLLNAVSREQDGTSVTYLSFIPVYQRRQFEQELINAKKAAEDALLRNDELIKLKQELEHHQTDLDRQLSYMRHRNDELEQFSKIISHDLQEPLRKITLFADLLSHEKPDALSVMGNRALVGIGTATGRMRQLIGDLQFYFTLTNQLPHSVDTVNLTTLVQELMLEFSTVHATFEVKTLPVVLGEKTELVNLFRHLLDNAVKFRTPGQPVAINVTGTVIGMNSFQHLPNKYRYSEYARIVVSDNGTGFGNQHCEEVFHILKKLHPHTPGIGLGLAISKKIVERHNGQISAQSAPGKGTQITVLLPVA